MIVIESIIDVRLFKKKFLQINKTLYGRQTVRKERGRQGRMFLDTALVHLQFLQIQVSLYCFVRGVAHFHPQLGLTIDVGLDLSMSISGTKSTSSVKLHTKAQERVQNCFVGGHRLCYGLLLHCHIIYEENSKKTVAVLGQQLCALPWFTGKKPRVQSAPILILIF